MTELNNLREKINEITLEMLKLLKTRTDLSKEIGNTKQNLGMNISDEVRENELRNYVIKLCKDIKLDEKIATRFLNFLLNESISVQSKNKQTHLSIFLKAKSLEEKGKKITHLEVGEPDFQPPEIVRDALEHVYEKGYGKYGPSKGMPELRESLAKKNSQQYPSITIDNIMVCPGARFGIYLAITTLLNPGDEIIIIEPSWPAFSDCAINAGIKVRSIKTTLENKWEPDIEQIENVINSNTKMIVMNYPNNPTGKILPKKLQDNIIDIAKRNDLYVLSDEIYSEYAFTEWKSVLSYGYDKSIITQSFSKSHAMTGYRIGYVIADQTIIDKMATLQALSITNVSEPIQYVALQALNADISNNSKLIKSKIDILVEKATQLKLQFIKPDGAMYIFAKMRDDFDATKFACDLLDDGVAIAPGEGFGDYRNFIRITAIQDEKRLIEGLTMIEKRLNG